MSIPDDLIANFDTFFSDTVLPVVFRSGETSAS